VSDFCVIKAVTRLVRRIQTNCGDGGNAEYGDEFSAFGHQREDRFGGNPQSFKDVPKRA